MEFLKGFTQDTLPSLSEPMVIYTHISMGAALPPRPESGGLPVVNV